MKKPAKAWRQNIWIRPIYLPYLHENLSDERLAEFERKIGFKLPKTLVELLKIQNGGYIRYGLFEALPMQIWGIGGKYPSLTLLTDEFSPEDIDYLDFSLDDLLAFDGDGHYYHCLDYRENKEIPNVSYIDIEGGEQKVIAENFDEFLAKLELQTDNFYVVKSEKPLAEVVEVFKKQLVIKFDEPNDFDYGYTQYRAKFSGHWLWLSPNEVPFAFARKGENNFERLKEYENKTAIRFPEINSKYLLLNIYNKDLLPKLMDKLGAILQIVKLSDLLKE